jgi:hypothetical protein
LRLGLKLAEESAQPAASASGLLSPSGCCCRRFTAIAVTAASTLLLATLLVVRLRLDRRSQRRRRRIEIRRLRKRIGPGVFISRRRALRHFYRDGNKIETNKNKQTKNEIKTKRNSK